MKHLLRSRDIPTKDFFSAFDHHFENFANSLYNMKFGEDFAVGKATYPKFDVVEKESHIELHCAVTGLSKEDVKVQVKDDLVTISADAQSKKEDEGEKYLYRELHKSSFSRSFKVDKERYEVDKLTGECKNGILTLSIPKRENVVEEEKVIDVKIV